MTATYETFSAGSHPATDTIREMLHAFNAAGASLSGSYSPDQIRGMERAAKVILDAVLGPVTDEEWINWEREIIVPRGVYGSFMSQPGLSRFLAYRRCAIEQPKAQTLQDRVFAILNDYGIVRSDVAEAIAKEVGNGA